MAVYVDVADYLAVVAANWDVWTEADQNESMITIDTAISDHGCWLWKQHYATVEALLARLDESSCAHLKAALTVAKNTGVNCFRYVYRPPQSPAEKVLRKLYVRPYPGEPAMTIYVITLIDTH